jgi:predicted naringenin-chalcone synthase
VTTVSVLGIGTALPPHRFTQSDSEAGMAAVLAGHPAAAAFARQVIRRSGIDARHTCVPEFAGRPDLPLLLGERSPPTSARMRAYREHAAPLAAAACRRALASAEVDAASISHLVVVTCTGFFAPGPDVELIDLLGLRPDVERTIVGFMGCYAAFNGIRVARNAVAAAPGTKALVVCIELCTLHFRPDPSPDNVVAHALFGDGAAAVVVGGSVGDDADALVRLGAAATLVAPDTRRDMGWEIADDGFRMTLSSYVPSLVAADVARFVAPLVGDADGVGVASWCVHPGGRAILDHVADALSLPDEALASARDVLRDIGNVSSASVLFVLEREIARLPEGGRGVMLGFGPGLTLEGLAFVRGPRVVRPSPVEAVDVVER